MTDEADKPITRREKVVIEYLCLGWNNKEIAIAMAISPRTVESYREMIYKKMRVRNAVELLRKVYRIGESA